MKPFCSSIALALLFSGCGAAPPAQHIRFSDAAQEVVDARVYAGIHFRFADIAARDQGTRVAEWAFKHYLLPLGHRGFDPHRQYEDAGASE